MPDPRQTRTNAADSAPGVDDGPAGARRFSGPKSATPGRGVVWVLVALTLLALMAIFILKPINNRELTSPPVEPPASATTPPAAP